MAEPFSVSILDQSIAVEGRAHSTSITNAIELAQIAEQLGYHRFWVSEHHNNDTIVGSAPEILMAAIAARTSRIRVGSAGVMLPHYAPYKVAEQFRVLEAIAPGRIDLGLGRAPGSDGRTAFALNPMANERPDQFPSDVHDLMDWLDGRALREGHPYRGVRAFPAGETSPEIWILGSSNYGAQVAAHFGQPYAFAWFFTDGAGAGDALRHYRELYKPSAKYPRPHAALCVWALAADSRGEAEHHHRSRAHFRLYRDRGRFLPLADPDVLAQHTYTAEEQARLDAYESRAFVGTGPEVADKIRALAAETGVQEMVVVCWAYDESARVKSYRLLAREFGLTAP